MKGRAADLAPPALERGWIERCFRMVLWLIDLMVKWRSSELAKLQFQVRVLVGSCLMV